ncbi:hypothetical protein D9599_21265 [Roseomonas sp. KE2513]|uniref:hypothetical protein n=1 Tax=Roseomonas sp. KE2513 TaxID=2479202 RepID=UPI0018DF9981|nr:hypothetical protein [Roseomonas sp. KE2513]MBI0538096.1 hypothetical protein [Roseomonas sp. KE2513]
MKPATDPFADLQPEAATDLSAEEALGDLGWQVLRHRPGPTKGAVEREEPRFTALHPDFGVALLDLAPETTPGAVASFLKRLEEAGGPTDLPVIYHSLTGEDLWRLTSVLDPQFAALPPIPTQIREWPAGLRRVIEASEAPAAAPAEPAASLPSPAPVLPAASSLEPPLADVPVVEAPAEPPVTARELPPLPRSAPPPQVAPALWRERPPLPAAVPPDLDGPARRPPAETPAAAPAAEAGAIRHARVTAMPQEAPRAGQQSPTTMAELALPRRAPVVPPRPPLPTSRAGRRSRRRLLLYTALAALLVAGGVATALLGGRPAETGAGATAEAVQEATILPVPPQASPAPVPPSPAAPAARPEAEAGLPPPPPAPPPASPPSSPRQATSRFPGYRGEPLVPTPGPQAEVPRAPAPLGRRIVVHYPPGLWDGVEILVDQLSSFGVPVERRVVGATPSRRVIRYFNPVDQDDAEALARSLGRDWMVQDFTTFTPRPRQGTLEVWVPAGAG